MRGRGWGWGWGGEQDAPALGSPGAMEILEPTPPLVAGETREHRSPSTPHVARETGEQEAAVTVETRECVPRLPGSSGGSGLWSPRELAAGATGSPGAGRWGSMGRSREGAVGVIAAGACPGGRVA